MKTKTSTRKLKIIPGRGLTGLDIKKRLNNRTLITATFGEDAYMVDEKMIDFTRMSRVEQINEIRRNNAEIRKMENKLDEVTNAKNKRLEERRIENEINKRLTQIRKEDENKDKG